MMTPAMLHASTSQPRRTRRMPKYVMAPHVHACRTTDHVVILDLRGDRYLAVGAPQADRLADLIDGWPPTLNGAPAARSDPTKDIDLLQQLLAQGLVAPDGTCVRNASPIPVAGATATLVGEYATECMPIRTARCARFFVSMAWSAFHLHARSVQSAVKAVEALRDRAKRRKAEHGAVSRDRAREAVSAFVRLRPLGFAARDGCLFDSLTLIRFLAFEELYPCWVIGVKTNPFGAHSWVQHGEIVYNDLPERVRKFKPILVV